MSTALDIMRRLRERQAGPGAAAGQISTTTTTKDDTMNGQQPLQPGQPAAPQFFQPPPQQPATQPMQPQAMQPMMMAPQAAPMFAPPMMQQPMQMPMQALPQATGVSVQIEIETPSGKATAFLNYGPEWAVSSTAMKQLIGALQMAGFPVKAWVPKGGKGGGW